MMSDVPRPRRRAKSPSSLPSFSDPPVAEVALGAHFRPFINLGSVDFGRLSEIWADRFPETEDQPMALPGVPLETFEPNPLGAIEFNFGPPERRVWYLSSDRRLVVQLQRDRLVINWRRADGRQPYPRYKRLRPIFKKVLGEFFAYAVDRGLGTPQVAQTVVSYTNPILRSSLPRGRRVSSLISPWSGQRSDSFLPDEEDAQVQVTYRIPDGDKPIGRLYVQGGTEVTPETTGGRYVLAVFARVLCGANTEAGALRALDVGHEWVVNGFTSFTTPTMHKRWGKEP